MYSGEGTDPQTKEVANSGSGRKTAPGPGVGREELYCDQNKPPCRLFVKPFIKHVLSPMVN